MSIQEIGITNNQRKQLLRAINNEKVLFTDDNGDLVVNVAAYLVFKETLKKRDADPIEVTIGAENLDFDSEFFVFS